MEKPKREDYHDWCPECKGKGTVPRRYRRGGWAGENVTVQETCPTCKGKKVYDDEPRYYKDLEKWADNQEIDKD